MPATANTGDVPNDANTAEVIASLTQQVADAVSLAQQAINLAALTPPVLNPFDAPPATSVDEVRHGIKPPNFWQRDPLLWFAQLEAQFHTAHITSDTTKYYIVVSALDYSVLQPVADIIAKPPDTDKYGTIKAKLIAAYTDSQERQLRKLLNELELGDKRPSLLYREMKALAGDKIKTDVLKTLWMQRLPTHIQMIISATDCKELDKMADVADKLVEIHATNIPTTVYAIDRSNFQNPPATPPDPDLAVVIKDLQQQVVSLTTLVAQLQTTCDRNSSRPRTRSNSTSNRRSNRQPSTPNQELCFYHQKFGRDARKCRSPCSFKTEN